MPVPRKTVRRRVLETCPDPEGFGTAGCRASVGATEVLNTQSLARVGRFHRIQLAEMLGRVGLSNFGQFVSGKTRIGRCDVDVTGARREWHHPDDPKGVANVGGRPCASISSVPLNSEYDVQWVPDQGVVRQL